MRVEYNKELEMIKNEIMLMSTITEKMLSDSVFALNTKDVALARTVIELADEIYMKPLIDIPLECELAKKLLKLSMQAFIHEDISRLRTVIDLENQIDEINEAINHECMNYMMEDANNIHQGTVFCLIGGYLERIGDHATNIFETVFYIVTGNYIDFNDLNEETINQTLGLA